MIFVGDIAAPFNVMSKMGPLPKSFSRAPIIANLEGDLVNESEISTDERRIYNGLTILDYLVQLNVKVVSLANNHILDVHDSPDQTIKYLKRNGILSCGAGNSLKEASKPCLLKFDDNEILFLAFGWDVIECQIALSSKPGVNPLIPEHVIHSVVSARHNYPSAAIILLMHWDYELELYPQPMHRQLAFKAIDVGADAIIGCHSHCVQGIETYKGKIIVYGLGNWMFTQNEFWGGGLKFPDYTLRELAFEWASNRQEMKCHWFIYRRDDHSLSHLKSEQLADSEWIKLLTPYQGMSHDAYIKFFRANRRKRKLLPVYKHSNTRLSNEIRNYWVKLRGMMIELLLSMQLKCL